MHDNATALRERIFLAAMLNPSLKVVLSKNLAGLVGF